MPVVDLEAHPLLTGKVIALSTEKRDAQQDLAEALLGVDANVVAMVSLTQSSQLKLALVLQLNFQVEAGLTPYLVSSESSQQQAESKSYRSEAIHPQALLLMQGVLGSLATIDPGASTVAAFGRLRGPASLRTQGNGGLVSPITRLNEL